MLRCSSFFRAVASRDVLEVSRMLDSSPGLALGAIRVAASRQDAHAFFLDEIRHYVYSGDTGLHIAAAAYERETAQLLIAMGANPRARNRRGAEPIHYAADGIPDGPSWDPGAQQSVIEYLIATGADPNAWDNSGVAALHRAVRTRCSAAVRALLENGADPRLMNKRGSTPLHLAVQNTGRGESGTAAAKDQQRQIIALLLQHGATRSDTDANGKTVEAAAASEWIRELLSAVVDIGALLLERGVLLESPRGPIPNVAELVAGEPITGSWWSHPASHSIFEAINELADSPDVVRLRLVNGKVTLVHRRVWPALVRVSDRFRAERLASVVQEHTVSGAHRTVETPFPNWVPREVVAAAAMLTDEQAFDALPECLRPGPFPLRRALRR